jgi:hypothetical protein
MLPAMLVSVVFLKPDAILTAALHALTFLEQV